MDQRKKRRKPRPVRRYPSSPTKSPTTATKGPYTAVPGSILWLPSRNKIADKDIEDSEHRVDDRCFDHPVLLLSSNDTKTEATVLIITSLSGIPLHIRHEKSRKTRMKYLPIAPTPAHPDCGIQLELEGEALYGNSHVAIRAVKQFCFRVLQRKKGGASKLKASSFATLQAYVSDIPVESYVPAAERKQVNAQLPRPIYPSVQEYHTLYPWNHYNAPGTVSSGPQGLIGHFQQSLHATHDRTSHLDIDRSRPLSPSYPIINSRAHLNGAAYGTFPDLVHTPFPSARIPKAPKEPAIDNESWFWKTVSALRTCLWVLRIGGYGSYLVVKTLAKHWQWTLSAGFCVAIVRSFTA